MKPFFKELFEYSHYYNQQLADIFINNPENTSAKSINLFSHILNAHQIWTNRISPKQPLFGGWQIHEPQRFQHIDQENFNHSLFILDQYELEEQMNYTVSTGQTFTSSIRDILFQVINHSTYHRAQIATEFKQHGIAPLPTDYIFYKRR